MTETPTRSSIRYFIVLLLVVLALVVSGCNNDDRPTAGEIAREWQANPPRRVEMAPATKFAEEDAPGGRSSHRRIVKAPALSLGTGTESIACEVPAANAEERVIMVRSGGSRALSTVSVGAPNKVTYVSTIDLEAGDTPLYLILASKGRRIWRIQGATDRLSRVILANSLPYFHAGVTGVESGLVDFVNAYPCIPSQEEETSRDKQVREALVAALGRSPDTELNFQFLNHVMLPAGDELDPYSPTEPEYDVISIDPRSVTSSGEVNEYEILPISAGLAQLVNEGFLRPIDDPDMRRPRYEVVKPFSHMPPGLSTSVLFDIPAEFPMPEGYDKPYYTFILKKTGECVRGYLGSCGREAQ
ncbi:hypothetical protein [Henriciella aquimarina]|uniref:hypothetical protein n=1 Tax=Henriciella aquimarina TaxID=545261 RepID=UPI001179B91C|nr:hypothetical protein [Henriciella aquimarina]